METLEPKPEQVSPTPPYPLAPMSNGAVRAMQENQQALDRVHREMMPFLDEAARSRAILDGFAMSGLALSAIRDADAFATRLTGLSAFAKLADSIATMPKVDLSGFGKLADSIAAMPKFDLPKLYDVPKFDFDMVKIAPPPMRLDFVVPPRPATGADMHRLEDRIADLEDEVRMLRSTVETGDPQERQRIAETHLRVEQVHEYFVPPEDSQP